MMSIKPTVFVTGAAGKIGTHTIEYLHEQGFAIQGIDRVMPGIDRVMPGIDPVSGNNIASIDVMQGDINQVGPLAEAMAGCDVVLHLAAITLPWRCPPDEMFRINCHGTFCVYQAAAAAGIRKVICASSINALGSWFGQVFPPIKYLPVDEGHPSLTTDIYSFSKQTMESIGAYFWRRDGIANVSFRMGGRMMASPGLCSPEVRATMNELLALPGNEGQARIQGWMDAFFQQRQIVPSEQYTQDMTPTRTHNIEGSAGAIISHVCHFWTSLDIRDRLQAFEKALLAELEGSHPLFIHDSHTCIGMPSQELAALCYPAAEITRSLRGTEALISLDLARELIGFDPQYPAQTD